MGRWIITPSGNLGQDVQLPRGMKIWYAAEAAEPRWYTQLLLNGVKAWRCPHGHNPKWTRAKMTERLRAGLDTV
jgi:hypothetical protein